MDAETVKEIARLEQRSSQELTRDVTLQNGQVVTYSTDATEYGRELKGVLTPPQPKALEVETLTGLVDAIKATGVDASQCVVHVEDYLTVTVKDAKTDQWGNRGCHIKAVHDPVKAFVYDYFYDDPQKFIIVLQATFLQTEELRYLIKIASNLKAGNTVNTQDDGFSQTVTVKTGEVSSAEVRVKPRIKLIPIRTFPEASPVESEFLIRFRQTQQGAPSIALFDVDGGKWKGDLMRSVKKWLQENLDGSFVVIA